MLRVAMAQVGRRRGRTLAVVAAILVASVSFSLLTAAVATSKLQVQGTVEQNYRTAYDILVRPPDSQTELERTEQLVRNNFLSGIFGGISMRQYRDIAGLPGIEVAAPVAMVGYFIPTLALPVRMDEVVTDAPQQVFQVESTWVTDRGLTRYRSADSYVYVSEGAQYSAYGEAVSQPDPVSGDRVDACSSYNSTHSKSPRSAFDTERQSAMWCFGTDPPRDTQGLAYDQFKPGQVGSAFDYYFPLLLAAVDPLQEARLVGLDSAVTSGRYLRERERPPLVATDPGETSTDLYRRVPVIMPDDVVNDTTLKLAVRRLTLGDPDRVPSILASRRAGVWLEQRRGVVLFRDQVTSEEVYPRVRRQYEARLNQRQAQYWSTGEVEYDVAPSGHLAPTPTRNGRDTWLNTLTGYYLAPEASADTAFRNLTAHLASPYIEGNVHLSPTLRTVGTFDPEAIQGFSELSRVPLTTYTPPDAQPGDAAAERLLGGKSLLPNSNLAGYLQQPPMMLTNLRSLNAFTDTDAYSNLTTTIRKPISTIRVRVAGVSGADDVSQERVRLAAERIVRETGLDVDITIGSSPQPQLIDLPAGEYGRPPLTLEEGWSRKGVAVGLLSAVDRKSLTLFGLVLVVCMLFLLNATIAAVRARRTELGVLATLGWPARRIFTLLQAELLATGLLAGAVGTGLAVLAGRLLALPLQPVQLLAITPVAMLLAGLAGAWPAWKASHAAPLDAIRPAVRASRRPATVGTITRLGLVGLVRWPGRTVLGAASLFVGVAALAVLVAIQNAFQGDAVGTLLGDAVAIQVRGVDYLAAGLTIALGAFAVADVAYLNITERVDEIGTLRASGWAETHVRRLFATEATATAALGAVAGAIAGIGLIALLLPLPVLPALAAAGTATAVGLSAAIIALAVPLARTGSLAPAAAIASE